MSKVYDSNSLFEQKQSYIESVHAAIWNLQTVKDLDQIEEYIDDIKGYFNEIKKIDQEVLNRLNEENRKIVKENEKHE